MSHSAKTCIWLVPYLTLLTACFAQASTLGRSLPGWSGHGDLNMTSGETRSMWRAGWTAPGCQERFRYQRSFSKVWTDWPSRDGNQLFLKDTDEQKYLQSPRVTPWGRWLHRQWFACAIVSQADCLTLKDILMFHFWNVMRWPHLCTASDAPQSSCFILNVAIFSAVSKAEYQLWRLTDKRLYELL